LISPRRVKLDRAGDIHPYVGENTEVLLVSNEFKKGEAVTVFAGSGFLEKVFEILRVSSNV
jgi:uncharacterized protein YabN with tetrapyrrole methylase and pyrophosphatase domain